MKTPILTPSQRRRIAEKLTRELMRNNLNERAARLQLRDKNERDLGGYCRNAVREIITANLP